MDSFLDTLGKVGDVASKFAPIAMHLAPMLLGLGAHIHRLEEHVGLPHKMEGIDKDGSGIIGTVANMLGLGDEVAGKRKVKKSYHKAGSDDVAGDYETAGEYTSGGRYQSAGSTEVAGKKRVNKAQKKMSLADLFAHSRHSNS